jgi:uncharacterized coiled-coil DUF342 family protein
MQNQYIHDMWTQLQDTLEHSTASNEEINTMINMIDTLANHADELHAELHERKLAEYYSNQEAVC